MEKNKNRKFTIFNVHGNLKLGEEIRKDGIFNMSRAWDKEKCESPTGIEPMTSRTQVRRSSH